MKARERRKDRGEVIDGLFTVLFNNKTQATWNLEGVATTTNAEANITAITKHSPFTSTEDLHKRFDVIGEHGTYIVVFNLRKLEDSQELDFSSNRTDI